MEKGIRQKRYQKFTKNGKEWTEWFDWSGEEPEWQLKGRLRNEYRTIYPSGGSSLDGQGSSRADDGKAATANGNGLQRLLSLRRVASTTAAPETEAALFLQGEKILTEGSLSPILAQMEAAKFEE